MRRPRRPLTGKAVTETGSQEVYLHLLHAIPLQLQVWRWLASSEIFADFYHFVATKYAPPTPNLNVACNPLRNVLALKSLFRRRNVQTPTWKIKKLHAGKKKMTRQLLSVEDFYRSPGDNQRPRSVMLEDSCFNCQMTIRPSIFIPSDMTY